jgi:hypothetical protein
MGRTSRESSRAPILELDHDHAFPDRALTRLQQTDDLGIERSLLTLKRWVASFRGTALTGPSVDSERGRGVGEIACGLP